MCFDVAHWRPINPQGGVMAVVDLGGVGNASLGAVPDRVTEIFFSSSSTREDYEINIDIARVAQQTLRKFATEDFHDENHSARMWPDRSHRRGAESNASSITCGRPCTAMINGPKRWAISEWLSPRAAALTWQRFIKPASRVKARTPEFLHRPLYRGIHGGDRSLRRYRPIGDAS
jgi:hypothetical protein